jgi:hypothetical protein
VPRKAGDEAKGGRNSPTPACSKAASGGQSFVSFQCGARTAQMCGERRAGMA